MPILSKKQWIILGSIVFVGLVFLLFLTGVIPGLVQKRSQKVELNFIGFDDRRVWQPIIEEYRDQNRNVTINYQQFDPINYENDLLNLLASGEAPDIFMFISAWLPKHFDKILPVSESQFSFNNFQNLFPTVAVQDFAPDKIISALPLYIDTLALYYNKDIFDKNGIAIPPRTWVDFQNQIRMLRKLDRNGKLIEPAVAIGGSSDSMDYASDLLNLLFSQAGVPMVDELFTRADFASVYGRDIFDFYLKFSNPKSDFYTWNDNQQNAFELFSQGLLPMMFGYRLTGVDLRQVNPFLNFGVAAVPQPITPGPDVAYSAYAGLAVSNKTNNQQAAWDFIIFAATNQDVAQEYTTAVGQLPALRLLIQRATNDPDLEVFARQALIARSWPQIDSKEISRIFDEMIKSVLQGRLDSDQAIRQAEEAVTSLINRR